MVQVLGFDYENDLEYLFNKQINLISEVAKNTFKTYEKENKHANKQNLWDINNFHASWIQGNGAIKRASNDLMGEKVISVLIAAGKDIHIPKLGGKQDTIVFVLKDDGVNVYKSSFKHMSPGGIVGSIDYLLIAPKHELKNVKTWSFSNEGFLSRLSYDSTEIKNGVTVKINLDGDKLECNDIYQPLLHLFLYFAKNGGKENLSEKELQKIFLDKYILDMKNKPVIPTDDKEEKTKVLDEKKGSTVKTKVTLYDGKKYDEYGFDKDGYNREGFDAYGYDRDGYNRKGYNKKGFDKYGFDKDGYNKLGLNENGYDRKGYDKEGYDEEGYDKEGYDRKGYDEEGYDKEGYDKEGYDEEGYNKEGYDKEGYNKEGYDKEGYDKGGYDKEGYNEEGFNRRGVNKITGTIYDKKGFDMNGFDKNGINIKTGTRFNKDGYDRNGYNEDDITEISQAIHKFIISIIIIVTIIIILAVLGYLYY